MSRTTSTSGLNKTHTGQDMSKELEVLAEKLRARARLMRHTPAAEKKASIYREIAELIDSTLQETADD